MMKLEEIEKLCDEATPGPWECKDHPEAPFDGRYRILGPYHPTSEGYKSFDNRDWNGEFSNYQNAKFIAASRELMPKLLAVAKAADDMHGMREYCSPELIWALEELEKE